MQQMFWPLDVAYGFATQGPTYLCTVAPYPVPGMAERSELHVGSIAPYLLQLFGK